MTTERNVFSYLYNENNSTQLWGFVAAGTDSRVDGSAVPQLEASVKEVALNPHSCENGGYDF